MFKHIENYLIIITFLLIGSLIFLPFCYGFDVGSGGEMIKTTIMFREQPVYITFVATISVLCLVSLYYFKKYLFQLRLEVISFLLLLIFNIIFICNFFKMHGEWSYTWYSIFPLISLILTGMAIYRMVYPAGPGSAPRKPEKDPPVTCRGKKRGILL
ncbi:MAG: DUF4293 family protein [Bacteroidales bacterium]|jgi:hypothetical protein|nr:DUF4293 family protein [Bacteroidales bacterium]MCI2121382.1 DUF4293 family protein [Bacteroidales bacterium]MCI2145499.1 DUF4293 family protein [Bacteroidales bacterium]